MTATVSPSGKRIVITGGAGFIGSSLALRLAEDNELVLFDLDFAPGKPIHYTGLLQRPNVTTLSGDIRDDVVVAKAVAGAHVVVHAAAIVGVHRVIANARDTIETNFTGTSSLLRHVAEEPEVTRFVYFSTSEIFGGSSFRVDEAAAASVGTVGEARWSYAISKLAGEHLVSAYHKEFGLATVIVRPFNVFGPRRIGDHAVLRFAADAAVGRPLTVHGDGSQVRSWCFVDDFVDGLVATLHVPEAVGHDFNLGNARNTLTIYELARRIIRMTGSSSELVFEAIAHPDIDIRVPTTLKAEELLGYRPRFDMDDALEATLAWYREHPDVLARHDG